MNQNDTYVIPVNVTAVALFTSVTTAGIFSLDLGFLTAV